MQYVYGNDVEGEGIEVKIGDVVRLTCDNDMVVLMTVEQIVGTDVHCVWFNDNKQVNRGGFGIDCLFVEN